MLRTEPRKMGQARHGFTLLEVILSIALFSLLAGAAYPVYQSSVYRADLDRAADTATRVLRRAALLARGMAGDAPIGVHFAPNQATIFRGTTYALRVISADELIEFPPVVLSGQTEVTFRKFTGIPLASGSLTLRSPHLREIRIISWNAQGTITN